MPIPRRSFLKSVAAAAPSAALQHLIAQSRSASPAAALHPVGVGQDVLGHPHSLGFSTLAFKVAAAQTAGNLFIIEHTHLMPQTGPPLHLHFAQEEWFYVMEGKVIFQVGEQRVQVHAGESILGPRRVAHTFSALEAPARMLISFAPAGNMEQYFIDSSAHPSLAPTRDFINRYEMQWLGPSPFWKT